MTTQAGTSEYDRFGPWIDEVRTPEDLPRLYRDHPLDLASARLVLKVPRNIPRRDATPEMDLYDHVLALDDGGLTVLSRHTGTARDREQEGRGYDVREVPAGSVAALRDVVDLLDGRLTVYSRDGNALTVPYNGSARANVQRLVDALRAGAARGTPTAAGRALLEAGRARAGAAAALDVGRDDLALVSDVRDVTRRLPVLTPWAGHGRRRVARRAGGAWGALQRAWHSVSPMTVHGAILAGDDAALEVLGRHESMLRGKQPVHSASRLVVPLDALDTLDLTPHPRYLGVVVAVFGTGASRVEVAVPEGSDPHRLLADAVARAAGAGLAHE
jgi:hypothetical protein